MNILCEEVWNSVTLYSKNMGVGECGFFWVLVVLLGELSLCIYWEMSRIFFDFSANPPTERPL